MTTTIQTPTTTAATTTPATTATPKPKGHSFSMVLRGEEEGTFLRIVAVMRPNGTAQTFAVHTVKDAKGKNANTRGATQQHANEASARKAVEVLATEAAKLGWARSQRRSGFTARPDAFTAAALPAPKAAKATSKKAR